MRKESWLAALTLLIGGAAVAQPHPANEQIGSWIIACPPGPDAGSCQLRHETWLLPPGNGHPSASLDVIGRGGQFVPVVAMRGLTQQQAIGGVLTLTATVGLSLDGGRRVGLPCGLDGPAIVCAPDTADATTLASSLPAARSALVQIQLGLPGAPPLPEQSRTLDLQRTADALARFRLTAPANETVPALPGFDWRGFLEQALRAAGYEHGTADLLPGMMPSMGGLRR